MSSISIEGASLSVWKIDDIRRQWAELRKQARIQSDWLAKAEARRSDTNQRHAAVDSKYQSARNALLLLLEEFDHRVRPFDPELSRAMSGQSPAEQYGRLLGAREKLVNDHPPFSQLVEGVIKAYEIYRPVSAERAEVRAQSKSLAKDIARLSQSIKDTHSSIDTLFARISTKLDPSSRAKVEAALYELDSGIGKIINMLITAQPEILTLTLVILMGVLGSALQIMYTVFRRNRIEKLGDYFLRLCVGAITALVIFIVAKAGVPVIADASRMGGDAQINPYFVSFLAIISGLLSENAIMSVQNQGARLFGSGGQLEPNRWPRHDLGDDIREDNLSFDYLAQQLGVRRDEVEEMLKGDNPVEPDQQKVIALYLRKPARDLFSDIAPAST